MTVEEIKTLSLEEKFQIMEILWEDMRDRFENSPVSPAIKAVLDERRKRVQEGSSQLLDWDAVKSTIGRS